MPPKANPKKLNPLQLRTLTLLQELARDPEVTATDAETGDRIIGVLPQPHGDHFHLGPYVVMRADATGLHNPAVMAALTRKGLARRDPLGATVLTPDGLGYDTGLREAILHGADH
ncbi:hypothetical protein [Roseospira visakhapatnamensis]|uniref:Uncharacterized protein n=1 Tax=Roseospira visakhapatnamensis TaxID=390880 RepID=A0A7W6REF9_9PROT|nr:hypothetical protein [Roseospira visakhapatnamensis]MBB4266978.1 hypothetical protein [Roseospira visakhapatnamensis]